jgi:hypothetical protein
MDVSVTLGEQFEPDVGAVILMNNFNVGPDEVEEEFIKVFADTTKVLSSNLGSFPLNCTEELLGVVHSLIMWDGNL